VAPRIALALTLHNHQPVGNFGWVIADVFERAYAPMIDALERHPGVRVALHYTGPLLDWLVAERPEAIDRLGALRARGQIEILGGGYYEPVLASLPERDRVGQLRRMADTIEARFGERPTGAWLAERVWEPDLPTSLAGAGYRWTILDDAHFRAAAIPEDDLWGPYTTEDQGHLLRVFGTEQGLRYRIPFRAVDEVIDYLRDHATEAGDRVGMMGDDGEKFGAWPSTWEHCWGEGRWVERFFAALEANASWLTTTTPSAWLAEHDPIGRVYVPTGSYAEMGEWALPADESLDYSRVLHDAQAAHRPEARWLRGAFWRNFQVKYREVNDLHKQMLRASAVVAEMPAGAARELATDHLYQGQSNDCYWHGLFGGIYIGHMRLATHEHLIAAEDIAEGRLGRHAVAELRDLDMDGRDEVRIATAGQVVTVDLAAGAGIGAWDVRAVRHAVTSVMRRRPEAYHATLRAHSDAQPRGAQPTGAVASTDDGAVASTDDGAVASTDDGAVTSTMDDGAVASIHDTFRVKEAGLGDLLVYDAYERRSDLLRALPLDTAIDDWAMARATELGDAVDGEFELIELATDRAVMRRTASIADTRVEVTRSIILGGDRRSPTLECRVALEHVAGPPIRVRIGVEWATMMLGGGGNPAAWWELGGERTRHDVGRSATAVTSLAQGNGTVGLAIHSSVDEPTDIWIAPIETVSNSEGGFERAYQGSACLLSWPVHLAPGESWSRTVHHAVTTDRDLTADGR